MTHAGSIAQQTELLRTSELPLWRKLRAEISKKHIEITSCVLAVSYEDDADYEYGILVTDTAEINEYGFEYTDGDVESGRLVDWRKLQTPKDAEYHAQELQTALNMVRRRE